MKKGNETGATNNSHRPFETRHAAPPHTASSSSSSSSSGRLSFAASTAIPLQTRSSAPRFPVAAALSHPSLLETGTGLAVPAAIGTVLSTSAHEDENAFLPSSRLPAMLASPTASRIVSTSEESSSSTTGSSVGNDLSLNTNPGTSETATTSSGRSRSGNENLNIAGSDVGGSNSSAGSKDLDSVRGLVLRKPGSSELSHLSVHFNSDAATDGHEPEFSQPRMSPIIRQGNLILRPISKRKLCPAVLCKPTTTADLLFIRNHLAHAEREAFQRSVDDVWCETAPPSVVKSATSREIDLYGHIAYSAVAGFPLLIVIGPTSKHFIHLANVAAVLEETDVGIPCHFTVLTRQREEFKFATSSSPEYQLWIEDLLETFHQVRWLDDAKSLRSVHSSRSTRSAKFNQFLRRSAKANSPMGSALQLIHNQESSFSDNRRRSGSLPGTFQLESPDRPMHTQVQFSTETSTSVLPWRLGKVPSGTLPSKIQKSDSLRSTTVSTSSSVIFKLANGPEHNLREGRFPPVFPKESVPSSNSTILSEKSSGREGLTPSSTPALSESSLSPSPELEMASLEHSQESNRFRPFIKLATRKESTDSSQKSSTLLSLGRRIALSNESETPNVPKTETEIPTEQINLTNEEVTLGTSTEQQQRAGSGIALLPELVEREGKRMLQFAPDILEEPRIMGDDEYIAPRGSSPALSQNMSKVDSSASRLKFSLTTFISSTSDKIRMQLSRIPGPAKKSALSAGISAGRGSINSTTANALESNGSILGSESAVPTVRIAPSNSFVSMIMEDPMPSEVATMRAEDVSVSTLPKANNQHKPSWELEGTNVTLPKPRLQELHPPAVPAKDSSPLKTCDFRAHDPSSRKCDSTTFDPPSRRVLDFADLPDDATITSTSSSSPSANKDEHSTQVTGPPSTADQTQNEVNLLFAKPLAARDDVQQISAASAQPVRELPSLVGVSEKSPPKPISLQFSTTPTRSGPAVRSVEAPAPNVKPTSSTAVTPSSVTRQMVLVLAGFGDVDVDRHPSQSSMERKAPSNHFSDQADRAKLRTEPTPWKVEESVTFDKKGDTTEEHGSILCDSLPPIADTSMEVCSSAEHDNSQSGRDGNVSITMNDFLNETQSPSRIVLPHSPSRVVDKPLPPPPTSHPPTTSFLFSPINSKGIQSTPTEVEIDYVPPTTGYGVKRGSRATAVLRSPFAWARLASPFKNKNEGTPVALSPEPAAPPVTFSNEIGIENGDCLVSSKTTDAQPEAFSQQEPRRAESQSPSSVSKRPFHSLREMVADTPSTSSSALPPPSATASISAPSQATDGKPSPVDISPAYTAPRRATFFRFTLRKGSTSVALPESATTRNAVAGSPVGAIAPSAMEVSESSGAFETNAMHENAEGVDKKESEACVPSTVATGQNKVDAAPVVGRLSLDPALRSLRDANGSVKSTSMSSLSSSSLSSVPSPPGDSVPHPESPSLFSAVVSEGAVDKKTAAGAKQGGEYVESNSSTDGSVRAEPDDAVPAEEVPYAAPLASVLEKRSGSGASTRQEKRMAVLVL